MSSCSLHGLRVKEENIHLFVFICLDDNANKIVLVILRNKIILASFLCIEKKLYILFVYIKRAEGGYLPHM